MANITEKFRVKTFQGAETWTLPPTLSQAQVVLEEKNFFAITSSSEDVKDICFIKNELKAAFDVQHPDAKALAKAASENLMSKLKRTGLVREDEGEPTSRMKLLELTSSQVYIDSDVNYGHVQDLLGVDTSAPFEWNSKRSVGLFATVRRVFFGTLLNDNHPEANYLEPPFMGDFGNPPENILNTQGISGQMSDLLYLQSKHIHALHTWRMDYIQRVDHLLSFVLTDRLRTGYFNWHKEQYEKAEAARKKAEKEAEARKQAEEEARILKEKEERAARVAAEKKIQQIKSVAQQCRSWTRDDIQKFFSILSPEAMSTGQTLLANVNGASSSSATPGIMVNRLPPPRRPSVREKQHATLDKTLKEKEEKRVAAFKLKAMEQTLVCLEQKHKEALSVGSSRASHFGEEIGKMKQLIAKLKSNAGVSTGSSSSSENAGTTTTTTTINEKEKAVRNLVRTAQRTMEVLTEPEAKNGGSANGTPDSCLKKVKTKVHEGAKKAVAFAKNLTGGSTGSSSSDNTENAGTKTKPVEKKKDVFTKDHLDRIMTWWHGDGTKENEGLRGLISAKVNALSKGEDDPAYYNLPAVKALDKEVWMEWYVNFNIITHPFDLFHDHFDMMDQIQKECGKACRCAFEGFAPEKDGVSIAEYNAMERRICEATGKKYVEEDEGGEGEGEEEESSDEEEEEDKGKNNEEEEDKAKNNEGEKNDVVDLTVTIASKINDLDDEDTLKKYLETPGGKAACVFGYRHKMEESNTDNIFKKVRSTKNKKIDFKDIADLELTEEFITTYVIEFARHVHEYESGRTYALGSLVMLTPKAFDTLDGAQRRALPEKASTLWRVTHYNSDGTYEIVAEYNTIEKIYADEEDLRHLTLSVVHSLGGKQARKQAVKRPRDSGGASSSTGAPKTKQKRTKGSRSSSRKRQAFEAPNVTRDDVNLNTPRMSLPSPTQYGFDA